MNMVSGMRRMIALLVVAFAVWATATSGHAQTTNSASGGGLGAPFGLRVQIDPGADREELSRPIKIMLLLTALSLAPSAIVMMTSFTRILMVLGFLRQAMGTQQEPPGQILAAMSLFLTIFIMMPVWNRINADALQPYVKGEISEKQAWDKGIEPLRAFMLKQTGEKELGLFIELSRKTPATIDDVPLEVIVPAFMISELKTAFQMGFLIYLPFIVIDLIVASSLMALGMMMLPPMMVSLPVKLLFFVLADGWALTIKGIVASYAL